MEMQIYVYMLRCADKSYYVGLTRAGLDKRIGEHTFGRFRDCYTFRRRPVELVWSQEFPSLKDAIACERQLKGWRRAKKEALIAGDYVLISMLSRTAKVHPSTGSG
ncbi:MAG TPA: GIY-YIG nuclease family protein [Rhizomicrobium sp.]|jgi:predicted GIY-YIG superfamily endonuclease